MKNSRKTFLKQSALLGLGALSLRAGASSLMSEFTPETAAEITPTGGRYALPPLGYAYNALEPFIDATTMEIHYSKHHQAYVNKLNEAMDKEPALGKRSLEDMLMHLSEMPASVKTVIRNHGGGHWNHTFFWSILKTGTRPGPDFTRLATSSFGSLEIFRSTFEKIAMGVFGSGWAWVILQNGQMRISTTANQDNPLMDAAKVPEMMPKVLLGIDLWEHAYYLKHQNRRADYVGGFWNVINWDEVEKRMKS